MQETDRPTLSSSPVVKNFPPEIPIKPLIEETKTSASSPEKKQTLATLPLLRAELLKLGIAVTGKGLTPLYVGAYDQRTITIQQVSSQILTEQRESLSVFVQLASPFWLSVVGICQSVDVGSWVAASLPSTSFETYLLSPAAESWMNRCRLVRDVAVGVYQRRVLGATHIAWDTRQLYLDQEERAQLVPLISEKPIAENDDVFALGQLLWQVASRSTVLVEGWQKGKGLSRDCPPEVLALIQTCTDPVVSTRPSLKTLAKGLDAFWQRAGARLPDPVPSVSLEISPDKKVKKYESVPTLQSKEIVTGLYSESSVSVVKLGELKKTTPMQPQEFQHSPQDNLSPDSSPSSTPTDVKEQKSEHPAPKPSQSIAPSMLDSALSTGSLNILLIDDQTVGWLSPDDPRYCVGVKLCSLRDHFKELSESKAALSELQDEIQQTLLSSPIEVLLWVGEDGEDPSAPLADTSRRLWQAAEWQAYRPGDPPPTTWLPLLVNVHQQNIASPLFIRCHQLSAGIADFTEAEWRELHSQYALFWLAQGADKLTEPCNLYEANELYRAGRTRLVLHTETSAAYKLEESTYIMPHDAQGHLLPARYTRYATDSGFALTTTWEGRYQGAIGSQAVDTTSNITLMRNEDLSLTRSALKYDENQTPLGRGAFGEVLRGTYHGQAVAVKRFNKATLSVSDKAQLKDEAAVMANLHSDFLVHLLGLSLDDPPLLVMELAQGGSVYSLLKDSSKELPWAMRFRLLRDISLGLAALHAHELVHRDLKSPNILLDADGRAKLCDFGLSTLKSQAKETREVGTLLWNAPEVLQGKAATSASDIYSFAMVCWEVAARRLPYQTLSWKNEVVQQVQKGQREIIPNDCPPALEKIIAACWSQDPSERPTASQVAQVLESLWQEAVIAEQHAIRQSGLDIKRRQVPIPIAEPLLSTQQKTSITSSVTSEENFPSLLTAGSPGYLFNTKTTPSTQSPSETKHTPIAILGDSKAASSQHESGDQENKELKVLHDDTQPLLTGTSAFAFKILLAQSQPSRWQDKLSPQYTLGVKIQRLRQKVLADPFITQELSCYIAPNGQSQPGQPSDPLYPWVEWELLQGSAQVLVLQGMGGAGKSTFNRHLLYTLWQDPAWQAYRPGDPAPKAPMPVWIPLGSGQVHPSDLWDYYHHLPEIDGFTTAEIAVLQADYQLLWLADGYDEIPGQAAPNLYDLNRLGDYRGQVKLVIGCRTQRLQTLSEADSFVPHTGIGAPDWPSYRTRHVAPFTPAQTQDYIDKYVAQHRDDPDRPKDWDAARYKKEFAAFPELQTLIDTPFMLWMTLSILPSLASEQAQSPEENKDELKEKKDHDKKDVKESKQSIVFRPKITRAALYDKFMDGWFTRQARKAWQARSYLKNPAAILGKPKMQAIKEQASQTGSEDVQVHWLKHAYRTFCLTLAQQLTQAGQVSVRYEKDKEAKGTSTDTDWVVQLLGDRMPDSARLRQGCPLRESSDHTFSFMHASLLDYFLTTAIAEALLLTDSTPSSGNPFTLTHAQAVALLSRAHLTAEQVRFFVDRVKTDVPLQEALFALIERSKTDSTIAIASANAATVLNTCQINLSYQDWQNVQLPGADLRYGQLAYTNLQGANLRGATLMRTLLYRANLQAANLRDVHWGEWPRLQLEEEVYAVAHHPTQPWLAVGGQGKNIVLLHTETGERIGKPLTGHTDRVSSISFSPGGRRVVSGSYDNTVRLWDVEAQQALGAPLKGHTCEVTSVSFSPDGRHIVSCSHGGAVCLWDLETQLGMPLGYVGDDVTSVSFSPDGRRIVSGSYDENMHLWDVETQQALGVLKEYRVMSVSFSPDGRRIVSGSSDNTVRLWDVETRKALGAPLEGHTKMVMSVSFSPDGRRVVSGSRDYTVRLWDVETRKALGAPLEGHTGGVESVSFTPDGRRVVSGSVDHTVRLWDVGTQQALSALLEGHTKMVMSVSFSPDGWRVVSGSKDETARLWDVETQQALGAPLVGHTSEVRSVSFSPDGQRVVSGSRDRTLRLWDIETQQALGVPLAEHWDWVRGVSFSPDGHCVVSGSDDKTLRLWDVETQTALGAPLFGHTEEVRSVSFSPDGRHVVSGSRDHMVRLWDVETQTALGAPLKGHTNWVESVSFSPDGRHVVSGSKDETVRLWGVETQKALGAPLEGHTHWVMSVSFSSDGRRVVSGSLDQTVRLWDISRKQCVAVMHWHQAITTVAIMHPKTSISTQDDLDSKSSQRLTSTMSAEEDLLAIGDAAGTISFWAVSQKEASIRFLGMPRHSAMPLLVDGIALQGCRMDPTSKRLLAQYRAEVDAVVVEVAEEKQKKSAVKPKSLPDLSGQLSSTSSIKSTTLPQQPTPITPTSLTQTVQTSTASTSLYASSSAFFSAASSSAITSDKTNIKAPPLDEKKRKQLMPLQNELTKACEEGSILRVKAAIGRGAVVYPLNEGDKHPLYCAVYGMNPEVVQYVIEQQGKEIPVVSWHDCEVHNRIHYGRTFLNMNFDPRTYSDWYDLLIQIEANEFLTGHHLEQVKKLLGGSSKNYASFKALKGAVAQWKVRIVGLGEVMRERGFIEDAWGQTELRYKASRHQIKQMVDALRVKEVIPKTPKEQDVKSKQPTPKTKQTSQTTVAASTVTTSTNSFTLPSLSPQSESQTQVGLPRSWAFLISGENKALVTPRSAVKKSPTPSTPHSQLFPPVPDKKIPLSLSTPRFSKALLLEQAHALLDTACPPQNTHRAELRRDFLKQLLEYEQTGPMVPLTHQQRHALEELLQTLREMQPEQSQASTLGT